jgi:ribosomal protein L9
MEAFDGAIALRVIRAGLKMFNSIDKKEVVDDVIAKAGIPIRHHNLRESPSRNPVLM